MPSPPSAKTKTLNTQTDSNKNERPKEKFIHNKVSNVLFFWCQLLPLNDYCGHWGCDVGQQTAPPSSYFHFLHNSGSQQYVWAFHPSPNNCSGLSSLRVLTCTDVQMPTPKLKPFPSFPRSPPHNRIPMWEMSQQLRGKANQRNLLPVRNEGWPLDWGACNVSGPTKIQQIKTRCESELGQGWRLGADHRVIREEGMGPSF